MKKIKTRKALKKLVKKARRSSALKKWGTGAALGAVVVGAATAGGLALKRARAKAKKALVGDCQTQPLILDRRIHLLSLSSRCLLPVP